LDKKVKRKIWGGEKEGRKVSPEIRLMLRNVYLSAIRNTNRDLRPIKGNIIGNLYSTIPIDDDAQKDKQKKNKLLEQIISFFNTDEWNDFIFKGNKSILDHLDNLSYLTEDKKQKVKIGLAPFEFNDFLENLIIQLPIYPESLIDEEHPQRFFSITQNGLGYNNLIYTAAVLGDIKQRKFVVETEYNLLLIEEPEAHLHPQLQNTFFNYLKNLDENEERQIIVTSHSPTITSKTDLNLLTILQSFQNRIYSTQIDSLNLEEKNIKYLQKFLDVTKSQLFFSNGVILVEGISEALLVPIFSKILGDKYDIERNGIEVVNVNGTSFEHFAKLFNSENEKKRLNCNCSIITDDDKGKKGAEERLEKLESLMGGNLEICIGNSTFEYELFINNYENECLLEIIESLHSRTFSKIIDSSLTLEERGKILVKTISNSNNKSELAYLLSMKLEESENFCNFNVPEYIFNAIKFVVDV